MKTKDYYSSYHYKYGGAEISFVSRYSLNKNDISDYRLTIPIFGDFIYSTRYSYLIFVLFSPLLGYKRYSTKADLLFANGLDGIALVNTLYKKNINSKTIYIHVRSEIELFKISPLCNDNFIKQLLKFLAQKVLDLNSSIYKKRLTWIARNSKIIVLYNSPYTKHIGNETYRSFEYKIETPYSLGNINYRPQKITGGIKKIFCVGWSQNKGKQIIYELSLIFKDITFVVVGVNKKISKPESNNILFLGFISDWIHLVSCSDLILVPSLVPETFSRVTAEAMYNDKAVLASKIGNIELLLKEHPSCLVNNPCDISEWTKKILDLNADSLHN